MKQIEEAMSRLTVEQEGAENTALTQAVSADAAEKQEETREMEEENEKEGEEAQEAAAREEWETQGEEEQETEQETESQTAAEADLTDCVCLPRSAGEKLLSGRPGAGFGSGNFGKNR